MVSNWCVCVCVCVCCTFACVCAETPVHACMYTSKTDHMHICATCMPWVALGSVTSWTGGKRDVRVTPPCTHAAHKRKQRVWHQRHPCELRAAHRVGPSPLPPPLSARASAMSTVTDGGTDRCLVQLHGHQDDDGQTQRVLLGYSAVRQQRGNPYPSTLKPNLNPKPAQCGNRVVTSFAYERVGGRAEGRACVSARAHQSHADALHVPYGQNGTGDTRRAGFPYIP
jgi:hypothetical protein